MIKKTSLFSPILLIIIIFVLSRLLFLTRLPVFADEAIYIRWAQLSVNEPEKYLFLSVLDGKPPLHNWLIIPFLQVFSDPLFAARMLSVIAGAGTFYFLYKLTKEMTGEKKYAILAVAISILMPFWIINQRMALAESLLALFFTAGLYFAFHSRSRKSMLMFGAVWGLSLWTKTNAIFFAPVFGLVPFMQYFHNHRNKKILAKQIMNVVLGGILGGLIFLLLKKVEIFPALFSRSKDYTFTIPEILGGEWRYVLTSTIPNLFKWFGWYLTPSALVLMFYEKKKNLWLLLMSLAYVLPIAIMGRILSPRYFFPIVPLYTLMIVIGVQSAFKNKTDAIFAKILLGITLVFSIHFSYKFILNPDNTPFVERDRMQYLEDWSSGHGIPEVRDFITERIRDNKVSVATEGYFGTLPDGLLMYFDKSPDIVNLEIYGIGQPIVGISKDLREKASEREVYIVVNSHRYTTRFDPQIQKIGEYKRPNNAPSLLLLKINSSNHESI